MSAKSWIQAFRLRTLPLALSSILMGTFIAASQGFFRWDIFGLAILTTLLLQILSNLANDYGDSQNGADNADRIGPLRAVQSGEISAKAMLNGVILFSGFSLISGLSLLYISFGEFSTTFLIFLGLGLLCIAAAIRYTAGKNPYGYAGLGDFSVFLFFGLTGVIGSYFLYSHTFSYDLILPAIACGLYATGVLNLNNIRDIENDKSSGKITIPVRIGFQKALLYHRFLLIGGPIALTIYTGLNYKLVIQFLFLLIAPLVTKQINDLNKISNLRDVDPFLKKQGLTTLLMVLLFGAGLLLTSIYYAK